MKVFKHLCSIIIIVAWIPMILTGVLVTLFITAPICYGSHLAKRFLKSLTPPLRKELK